MADSAGWHEDPFRRHQQRYYDGATWTDSVADAGVQSTDHVAAGTPHYQVPPQSPTVIVQKSGSGCAMWIVAAAAMVFLLIVGVIVLAIIGASSGTDHPAKKDVAISSCTPSGLGGYWQAGGTIINHSSERSDYSLDIGYFQGTTRIGTSSTFETKVEPGSKVTWESGDIGSGSAVGQVTCRIIGVTRTASL